MRITCPDCLGSGLEKIGRRIQDTQPTDSGEAVPCAGCSGRGWIDSGGTAVLPSASPPDEQTSHVRIQKPRRGDGWLLALGAVILLGLLGHLFNQQRVSRQTSDADDVERPQRESAPTPAAEAPPSDATRRKDADNLKRPAAPTRVVYMVTHKHRLRDCHGSLTFTRKNLRFDSDEPEDSFDVGIDEVTIDDDVLRIDDKPWRFEFNDGVRVDRLFNDWKAGILTPVPAP